jgi:hypothetical protein
MAQTLPLSLCKSRYTALGLPLAITPLVSVLYLIIIISCIQVQAALHTRALSLKLCVCVCVRAELHIQDKRDV